MTSAAPLDSRETEVTGTCPRERVSTEGGHLSFCSRHTAWETSTQKRAEGLGFYGQVFAFGIGGLGGNSGFPGRGSTSRMLEKMTHSSKEAKAAQCETGSNMAAAAYCLQVQFQIINGWQCLSSLPVQGTRPGHLELLGTVKNSFNHPVILVLRQAPSQIPSHGRSLAAASRLMCPG